VDKEFFMKKVILACLMMAACVQKTDEQKAVVEFVKDKAKERMEQLMFEYAAGELPEAKQFLVTEVTSTRDGELSIVLCDVTDENGKPLRRVAHLVGCQTKPDVMCGYINYLSRDL
jgi:hypothetical protein